MSLFAFPERGHICAPQVELARGALRLVISDTHRLSAREKPASSPGRRNYLGGRASMDRSPLGAAALTGAVFCNLVGYPARSLGSQFLPCLRIRICPARGTPRFSQ